MAKEKTRMEVQHAAQILRRDLGLCASPLGLLASTGHFDDLWARDSLFAVRGALIAGMDDVVLRGITNMLGAERNGLIPLKIARGSQLLKLAGFKSSGRSRPVYGNDKSSSAPIDSTPLILIGLKEYCSSRPGERCPASRDSIERMVAWMLSRRDSRTGALVQGSFADWADSLKRTGSTSYAQVLFIAALESAAWLVRRDKRTAVSFRHEAYRAREALAQFWNGRYLVESLSSERFDSAANFLAIRFDLIEQNRVPGVLREAKRLAGSFSLCPPAIHPSHPLGDKSVLLSLAGMGTYHESHRWSWIAAVYLQAWGRYDPKEHDDLRNAWARKIIDDDGVYEVYEADGSPVNKLSYKSQKPFAWGAAMMLEALTG